MVGGGNSAVRRRSTSPLRRPRDDRRTRRVAGDRHVHYLIQAIEAPPNVDVKTATAVVGGGEKGASSTSFCATRDADEAATVTADALFILIGARPATDWLPRRHAARRVRLPDDGRRRRARPGLDAGARSLSLETSVPGVLAAGGHPPRLGQASRRRSRRGLDCRPARSPAVLGGRREGVRRDPEHLLGSIPWSRSRYALAAGAARGGSRCPGASAAADRTAPHDTRRDRPRPRCPSARIEEQPAARSAPRGSRPSEVSESEARTAARGARHDARGRGGAAAGGRLSRHPDRDQRTLWGSCSTTGTLSFNWRLVLAPLAVADYVVVHELCHLRVHGHSQRFWSLVERRRPDYREQRAWLREHGPELLAFRPAR